MKNRYQSNYIDPKKYLKSVKHLRRSTRRTVHARSTFLGLRKAILARHIHRFTVFGMFIRKLSVDLCLFRGEKEKERTPYKEKVPKVKKRRSSVRK